MRIKMCFTICALLVFEFNNNLWQNMQIFDKQYILIYILTNRLFLI